MNPIGEGYYREGSSGPFLNMQRLKADGEFVLVRERRENFPDVPVVGSGLADGSPSILVLTPVAEHPAARTLHKLEHELALAAELDPSWAAYPLALRRRERRSVLLLEDPGGEPLERRIGRPCAIEEFLRLAIAIAGALGRVHERALIHNDIRPANLLVCDSGQVFISGFGIASRSPRERQVSQPSEILAGRLPYIAPEQTGRMNRSVDARCDLYSLGITLFELLTGKLPFSASEPLDWVHCHIARPPASPEQYCPKVPPTVVQILLKLLAKSADERYQTADALAADWRHCLEQWQRHGRVEAFALGQNDAPDHLIIPERLYGRERELSALRSRYDEVAALGVPALILVAGYAGVGKSALVHEFHQEFVQTRCWFTTGKCDQYHREIPYRTVTGALRRLVRQVLGLPEPEIARWRERLLEALGANVQLIADLIPELAVITGPQPRAPEVLPPDELNRFRRLMRRFLGLFASAEKPLVLFLDDLQWLDAATLDLLQHLLTEQDLRHLLVIAAYRDHEVDGTHPLAVRIHALRSSGANVSELVLAPLEQMDIERLVADALQCSREKATELADLVHQKTQGNPFFAIQFLITLEQEDLLKRHGASRSWIFDLTRIRAKSFTDNVAHLLLRRLSGLSQESVATLQHLACLGTEADVNTLALTLQISSDAVHHALAEAASAGLVIRVGDSYRFLHDRVHEAAYSMIPEQDRPGLHLRIGRVLSSHLSERDNSEHVFALVNQLNRGRSLIEDPIERRSLAELNLLAARQACRSSAYVAALDYVIAGGELLAEGAWIHSHDLSFGLEFHRGECEFLTGHSAVAETRLAALASRATTIEEGASVAILRQLISMHLGRNDRAVDIGLEYLGQHGAHLRRSPSKAETRGEYERLWQQLAGRSVESLLNLPAMDDPRQRAILDVLASMLAPALLTDTDLFRLIVARMANLSLQHGNGDASALAYIYLDFTIRPELGDYRLGFRFGKLAVDLMDKRLNRFKPRIEVAFGTTILPWSQPMRSGLTWVRRSIESAQDAGDLVFASYSWFLLIPLLLFVGEPLEYVQRDAERALEFARKIRFSYMIDLISPQVAFLHALRGLTSDLTCFTTEGFEETTYERRLAEEPMLAKAAPPYWGAKLQAYFHGEDYAAAMVAGTRMRESLWASPTVFDLCDFHFYMALTRAASLERLSASEQREYRDAMSSHAQFLSELASNCPENFGARASLVAAELARLEAREADAQKLYEQAIHTAHHNDLLRDEAVALELAGRFYASRSLDTVAFGLLCKASSCFERWGAAAKVRRLERRYPYLLKEPSLLRENMALGSSSGNLDASTVIKAAQAVSSQIVLENLLETLLSLALKQAGAERGLLILVRDGTPYIEAEALTDRDTVAVTVQQQPVTSDELPDTILRYVMRTQESVIVDDAETAQFFAEDSYLNHIKPRSVLCQPLVRQGSLNGVLYLENKLVAGAFSPSRTRMLEVLGSQAAISLEIAAVHEALKASETRYRQIVATANEGIWVIGPDRLTTFVNSKMATLLGYTAEEVVGQPATDFMFAEDVPDHHQKMDRRRQGSAEQYERRFRHKDGHTVWMLVSATPILDEQRYTGSFAMLSDITERKRAEETLALRSFALNNVREAALLIDEHARLRYVNEEACRTLGCTPDELLGVDAHAVYTDLPRERWPDYWADLKANRSLTLEGTHRTKEGRVFPVEVSANYFEYDGSAYILALVRDISERKHAEEVRLEARVAERTRIARELHDTLLQNFQGVLLQFRAALRFLSRQPDRAQAVLADAIDHATHAVKEAREAVEGLRASAEESKDLATSLRRLGKELAAGRRESGASSIKVLVLGALQKMRPIVRDQVFWVAAEALRNAYNHAQSTQIEVELSYDARQFRLRVRDDGQGIDPKVLADGGRPGHFGLRGMHERAELAGGQLTVWSAPNSGTEVELSISGSQAYTTFPSTHLESSRGSAGSYT